MSEQIYYIVDWDIPLNRNRFAFYRQLNKLKKELSLHGAMSTKSVLITKDEYLATRVYEIAKAYAKDVHMYVGRQVR